MVTEKNVVLITGASRGIGKGIMMQFINDDYFVIGTATSENGLQAIRNDLEQTRSEGMALKLDLSKEYDIKELASTIKNQKLVVDVLVNNAGLTEDNLALLMKAEQWHKVINSNLTGSFLLCQSLLRPMIKQRHGRIINVSSVVASMGNAGQCNYSAAKAGLEAVTKSLAKEVAHRGITVNAVAPGFIETDMTKSLNGSSKEQILQSIPIGDMGLPEDIASAVRFLASSEARYITGHTLHVNGGLYM